MRLPLFLLVFVTWFSSSLFGQESPFDVYLLIGQSNMAGRGELTGAKEPAASVWMFTEEGEWKPAVDPIRHDKPKVAGVGPGISFAQRLLHEKKGAKEIGLVNRAFGGTRIEEWQKGRPLYNEAVKAVKEACVAKSGRLRGILWHQGESNYRKISSDEYAAALKQMIADLREDLGMENLPVVVGELGEFLEVKEQAPEVVNVALHQVARDVPNVRCVSAAGLKDKGDKLHFNAESQRTLGGRYAEAMVPLQ